VKVEQQSSAPPPDRRDPAVPRSDPPRAARAPRGGRGVAAESATAGAITGQPHTAQAESVEIRETSGSIVEEAEG